MDLRKEADKLKTELSTDNLADITSECNKLNPFLSAICLNSGKEKCLII